MGSVKDLQIISSPSNTEPGVGRFVFSDRYSVFDWGEMPDHIPQKGRSLAIIGAYFFEKIEMMGIMTHYIAMIEDSSRKRLKNLREPSDTMEVQLLRVIKPDLKDGEYDYSRYKDLQENFLIPLEIIYRNSLPEGSSVFKRLETGKLRLEDIGLKEMPAPGQDLPEPIFDVSTKLEVTDRYISWDEAVEMAGLKDGELYEIKDVLMKINSLITEEYARIGLKNEDGKIELGFGPERKLMVVDVVGTPDECRFTYQGIPVSKEIARIYYRKTSWYEKVEEAKRKDRQNWKSLVKEGPEPLPERLKELIGYIYQGCANELTGREWFKGVPPLKEVLEEIREYL